MKYPSILCLPLLLFGFGVPMAARSGSGSPHPVAVADRNHAPSHSADWATQDCDGMALADKRACHARQDQRLIDECERLHPMRCRPYRDMQAAQRELAEVERSFIASAQKSYANYTDSDAAYLNDLEGAAREANHAWREYREAQCMLEPFAQGMSRDLAEDLAEACRVRMTRARIDELKVLLTASD